MIGLGISLSLGSTNPGGGGGLAISGSPETAQVGSAYSFTPSVSGGTAPYTASLVSGELPAGLSLNTSTGAITGTPTGV